jgi:hypothetical protein
LNEIQTYKTFGTTSTQGPHLEHPTVGATLGQTLRTIVDTIVSVIRTKPSGFGKANISTAILEPWYCTWEDDHWVVTVPSDLESFSDDPGVVAAVAALDVLGATIRPGSPMRGNPALWDRCHKDVELYYFGIAAALREGILDDFHNYSGWFGKGYDLVKRRRLTREKLPPWVLRGSSVPMRKVWSHKAWGEKLPAGYKHLEVLVREASDLIKLDEGKVAQWVVPLNTLRGTKIKKHLPIEKVGFLLQTDIDALEDRFSEGIKTFKDFNSQYSKFTLSELVNIDDKIKDANRAVFDLDRVANQIIDLRASVLFPKETQRKRKKERLTLKERISRLDPVTFINKFGPYEALGVPRFSVSNDSSYNANGEFQFLDAAEQFLNYVDKIPEPGNLILKSWWAVEVIPRYAE